jgi:catechol 2,3-dioxygenase-like lactoylglutathione lyase family enzyme
MIKGLAHVCFFVDDLEASEAFYRDQLGLKPAFEFRHDDGTKFGQYFHAGGRTFVEIFQAKPDAGDAQSGRHRHICFEVDDIHATVAELQRRGVQVKPIRSGSDHSLQAWLADPDGNLIELHGYTAESKQQPWLD